MSKQVLQYFLNSGGKGKKYDYKIISANDFTNEVKMCICEVESTKKSSVELLIEWLPASCVKELCGLWRAGMWLEGRHGGACLGGSKGAPLRSCFFGGAYQMSGLHTLSLNPTVHSYKERSTLAQLHVSIHSYGSC